MPLKTLVKVGSITNLSDARYCAGMGVDMLGFRVIEGTKDHIDHKLYQQIRGWVSGPKFIAEFYGITEFTEIDEILTNFAPDYIEVTLQEYLDFQRKFSTPFIVKITEVDKIPTNETFADVAYWLTASLSPMQSIIDTKKPILFEPESNDSVDTALSSQLFSGLSLAGSPEERPGFKNYDELSDILEKLEEQD